MWKAAGNPEGKDPRRWADTEQGRNFVAELASSLNVDKNVIWKSKRGRDLGGTWADWRVAVAYAEYFSPEFHRRVIEAFREWVEERDDPGLKAERAVEGYRRLGWDDQRILARLEGIVQRKALTDILKKHGVEGLGYPRCTDAINREVLGGSAKEIKLALGLDANARTRDHLDTLQLAALSFAEAMARSRVAGGCAHGNDECCEVCREAGVATYQAMASMGLAKRTG